LKIAVGVAAGDTAIDAVADDAIPGGIADIEAEIDIARIVDARLDVALAAIGALADIIDQAAGIAAAIEHGGRPLQHFDPLKPERIHIEPANPVAEQLQAIHVGAGRGRLEAAYE